MGIHASVGSTSQTRGAFKTCSGDQDLVDESGLTVEQKAPDERARRRRDRPWQQDQDAQSGAAPLRMTHHQCQNETADELEREADDDKKNGVRHRSTEARIGDRFPVIGKTDEGTAQPRHAEVVKMQRLPHHPDQRKGDHCHDDAESRQQQPTRASAFGSDALGALVAGAADVMKKEAPSGRAHRSFRRPLREARPRVLAGG